MNERKLISIKQVCERTSLSRTTINNWRSVGKFPLPVPIGEKRFAFVESEIQQWIDERIAARSEAA